MYRKGGVKINRTSPKQGSDFSGRSIWPEKRRDYSLSSSGEKRVEESAREGRKGVIKELAALLIGKGLWEERTRS